MRFGNPTCPKCKGRHPVEKNCDLATTKATHVRRRVPSLQESDTLTFREWLVFSRDAARYIPDVLDPKAADMLDRIIQRYDADTLQARAGEKS